ncbi:MAG: hydrogenase maturation nickel metallochaperone HypA [Hydrogenibacillus sp.]|nr:hydrogenase maturation nickel metallochaperone HypA [Hydrogenibacillus sp.]
MHELSIAQNLVELAVESAQAQGLRRLTALHVRIGALSGVVKEALLFAFDVVTEGTPAQGAALIIEDVPVTIFCPSCQAERTLDAPVPMRCPECGTRSGDVRAGRELELVALEGVEEA